ncbi:MAG: hypothetical protein KKF52_03495 [Nanoarchaeota archaeon]|nr:hypothetical protein [Nanoarchaeota archaeon]MBU4242270.1 hypothetical protein [Nanoarchaeota archaeon]MBU4352352.1 hypothetical protein [Nanoarchaeota archaeon]
MEIKTPIFSRKPLEFRLIEPWIIEEEKRKEERRKNPNGPFLPLYAPKPSEDPMEDKPKEKEKRVIIIEYD